MNGLSNTSSASHPKSPVLPPAYFWSFSLLAVMSHFLLPLYDLIPSPFHLLGLPPIVLGVGLAVWGDTIFKREKTTIKSYNMPSKLVTGGPFAISRHPIYLGMLLALAGVAILCGSLTPWIFPALFAAVIEVLFIPFEEHAMETEFGEAYREYKSKVRRWL